ncbi:MAG TPA: sigma-70 family RNA polymerase sigma factor [Ktedonobacteraceae bacterium]|jgi:RNA polymerase sigma-70 factor (ECF subfamily)|nr:sigma-70 family RNA polymerase sigma factor [Ktedonobacteraceae bacterium]
METTIRATGPLGSLSIPGTPARKTRRKKAQAVSGDVSATGVSTGSLSTREEVASPYSYTRAASAETLSDVALVEQTLEGKQEAFAVLVERYKDAVQNLAYRMLSNVTEAEDVTQEVFVRAYTQLATYKPAHKFSTWLLSIASHLAIDQLRRRRFLALPLEDVPFLEWITDLGAGPEQSALAGEQQDEIQAYLQRLHSKYRAVIVLRYWYDFSYEEIATMLKLTPALVKARLHRARELLARYMKENQLQEGEQADVLARG